MFLCQGWYSHKEKENLVLNIMWDKFWFAGDFLFEIWTAWSPASTCRFHKESFFLSWQNGTLSFFFGPVFFFFSSFFLFLPVTLFRFWFSMRKDFSIIEFCDFFKVRDVNKIWKLLENWAPTWAFAMKFASGDSPYLSYYLLFENTFK